MTDLQTLGQDANGRTLPFRQSLQCEKHLMLLGLDARGSRFIFAEGEEPSDLVAQFGKRSIVDGGIHLGFPRSRAAMSVGKSIHIAARYNCTRARGQAPVAINRRA
jgi:hypothetical protein